MEIGTSLPSTELGADPAAIRDFAQAAEDLGYASLGTGDHVLGADPQFHPEVPNFYFTHESLFHEPFTLMGYLAAITKRMVLGTNVVILPQRQTSLVAKQAAEVDVLSGGRLRLGIGIGWNPVEFEALGQEFRTRGARFEEQVEVLRLLMDPGDCKLHGPLAQDNPRWHQPPSRAAPNTAVDGTGESRQAHPSRPSPSPYRAVGRRNPHAVRSRRSRSRCALSRFRLCQRSWARPGIDRRSGASPDRARHRAGGLGQRDDAMGGSRGVTPECGDRRRRTEIAAGAHRCHPAVQGAGGAIRGHPPASPASPK